MNLKELKEMIQLMNDNGLAELEVEKDNVKIRLKKTSSGIVHSEIPRQNFALAPAVSTLPPPAPVDTAATVAGLDPNVTVIRSPMVGTFYAAPGPEAAPYVAEGKLIKENDVLCIIEAMKLMNEIKSEVNGQVIAVLVKNGQAVEYDQPLFHVKKS